MGSDSVFLILYLYFQKNFVLLHSETNIICNMKTKKITYEQALARLKRSIEVKRNAERRMAEEWKAMGLQGNIVTL